MPKASTARAPTGTAGASWSSGASSGADQQPDGGSAYTYPKTSYCWVGNALVRQVDIDHGGFGTIPNELATSTSDQGRDQLPTEFIYAVR
jgi:hypothetical protein